jgi:HlyD family secretion protein
MTIRVSLPPAEVTGPGDNVKIIPGMPVEALCKPATAQCFPSDEAVQRDQLMSFRR